MRSNECVKTQKKIAIAVIAALAGPAIALAAPVEHDENRGSLKLGGIVWGGLESYKVSGHPKEARVSDQASRLIVSGEKVFKGGFANGLTGWFYIDSRLATDTGQSGGGTGLAAGPTGFGLKGNFGKFTVGRWDVHYIESANVEAYRSAPLQAWQGFGPTSQVYTGVVAGFSNSTVVNRVSNLLMWDSSNYGGLTVRVAYSPNPGAPFTSANAIEGTTTTTTNGGKGDAWSGALRYASGPITTGVSLWNQKVENNNVSNLGDTRSTRAWFAYSVANLKAGLMFDQSEARLANGASMTKRTAWMIPVSYSQGPHKVYFTYASLGKSKNATGTIANSGARALTIGYDFEIEQGTYVGAFYSSIRNQSAASYDLFGLAVSGGTLTAPGENATQLYIGGRYDF